MQAQQRYNVIDDMRSYIQPYNGYDQTSKVIKSYTMQPVNHPQIQPMKVNYPKIIPQVQPMKVTHPTVVNHSQMIPQIQPTKVTPLPAHDKKPEPFIPIKTVEQKEERRVKIAHNLGTVFKLGSELGEGGYGTVHRGTDEKGNLVAIKLIDVKKEEGIPHLMEMSVMSSIEHPNIARAHFINVTTSKVQIIQEIATTDLSVHTRATKGANLLTAEQLKKWSFSLVQAIACLHKEQLIHCDIKANNALLYADGEVRLSDFTLITKRWTPETTYKHNIGTSTHRALEVLLGLEWNEKVDIWALGCTLYEIAYGESLFPYQGWNKPTKEQALRRYIDCILEWSKRETTSGSGYEGSQTGTYSAYVNDCITRKKYDDKVKSGYKSANLCQRFKDAKGELSQLNQLILSMLRVNPAERPSILDILYHPYFSGLPTSRYTTLGPSCTSENKEQIKRIDNFITQHTANQTVAELTKSFYMDCQGLKLNHNIKMNACFWMASKLVTRKVPSVSANLNEVIAAERAICLHLDFRLHKIVKDKEHLTSLG